MGFEIDRRISMEEGLAKYEVHGSALQHMAERRLARPQPPMQYTQAGWQPYQGEIPIDLTQLNDDQLGALLTMLSAYLEYASDQLSEARSMKEEAESQVGLIEAQLRSKTYKKDEGGRRLSNPEREDLVKCDREYVEASSEALYWNTIYTYTKNIVDSTNRKWETVSRRMTQRGQDLERERRTHNVNNATFQHPMIRR